MSGSQWACSLQFMIKVTCTVTLAHFSWNGLWSPTRDINMRSTGTNIERNWLMAAKNYFCFDVPTSDPLLFAAKLIAYASGVDVFFIVPHKQDIFWFFPPWRHKATWQRDVSIIIIYNSYKVSSLWTYSKYFPLIFPPQIAAGIFVTFGAVVLLGCPHFPNDNLFAEYFHWRSKEKAWCWGFEFVLTALVLVGYGFVALAYFHFLWMKPIRHLLLGLKQVDWFLDSRIDPLSNTALFSSLHWSSYPGWWLH